jgi:hypothetical protein
VYNSLKKGPFYFITSLLKVNFKNDTIHFVSMKFMNDLMQDDYLFRYMLPWHEGRLYRFNSFMDDPSYSISAYLSECLKTQVE